MTLMWREAAETVVVRPRGDVDMIQGLAQQIVLLHDMAGVAVLRAAGAPHEGAVTPGRLLDAMSNVPGAAVRVEARTGPIGAVKVGLHLRHDVSVETQHLPGETSGLMMTKWTSIFPSKEEN